MFFPRPDWLAELLWHFSLDTGKSIDLDFFGRLDLDPFECRQELETPGEVSLRSAGRRIQHYVISGVQVDLVDYSFYAEKFSDGDTFLVLKSLVFFDDADDDPMPNMLKAFDWVAVKKRITDAVVEVSR